MEERLAFVEGRMTEFSSVVEGLREAIARLDRRLAAFEARMDQRFASIDQRFADVDAKMSRQFHWLLGVQITMFIAMVGTILTAFLAR